MDTGFFFPQKMGLASNLSGIFSEVNLSLATFCWKLILAEIFLEVERFFFLVEKYASRLCALTRLVM